MPVEIWKSKDPEREISEEKNARQFDTVIDTKF